ncbi:hypothetical protein ABFX02_13G012200 [Erythranthe guttata]
MSSLIFIPFPVMSHLVHAVEVAKLISDRERRLSITVLIIKMPFDTKISSYIKDNSLHPGLNFVHLPENESASAELLKSPADFIIPFIESQNSLVRDAVSDALSKSPATRLAGFVADHVCISAMDVAAEFGVPTYIFHISSAAALGLMFHCQTLSDDHGENVAEYEDSDDAVIYPPTHVNPFPAKLLPDLIFKSNDGFLDLMRKSRQAKGFVVNTFLELEPHSIDSLSWDKKIPPVYPVGPLMFQEEIVDPGKRKKSDEIIGWLNQQPDSSVVFLCFGSNGYFEVDQVKEIAVALERSGHRFLWALRRPPYNECLEYAGEYEDPREVLPGGFLEKMVGIGRVIGWAPQQAILSHRAVGGFFTHCGWNSIVESVSCGVPMAAWPQIFEQQANAFQIVEEIGVGVEVKMDYRKIHSVIVAADVIEGAIGRLMDPENEDRVRVNVLKEKSRMALMKGESSYNFLGDLIADIMDN